MSENEHGFKEGDDILLDDGSGKKRPGRIERETADSYFCGTPEGYIWIEKRQAFPLSDAEPEAQAPSEQTPESADGAEAPASPKPKRGRKKAA